MFETVDYSVTDRVSTIRLNRPEVLNAWSGAMGRDLSAAIRLAANDDDARAIVVCGAGRAFCAGADLNEPYSETPEGHIDLRSVIENVSTPLVLAIRETPKPVIASVRGAVAGVGLGLVLACDLVVAAESAFFLMPFTKVGLVPDGGSLAFVNARVGAARAAELALLAQRLPAAQALDWGLVNRIHPDDRLEHETATLATQLATGAPLAFANTKRLLNATAYPTLTDYLALEADLQQEQAESGEFTEGVAAFMNKRPPRFGNIIEKGTTTP